MKWWTKSKQIHKCMLHVPLCDWTTVRLLIHKMQMVHFNRNIFNYLIIIIIHVRKWKCSWNGFSFRVSPYTAQAPYTHWISCGLSAIGKFGIKQMMTDDVFNNICCWTGSGKEWSHVAECMILLLWQHLNQLMQTSKLITLGANASSLITTATTKKYDKIILLT